MEEKAWRTLRLTINGLGHKVRYNQETIDNLFLPFLRRMTKLQREKGTRIVVYLVAPPGTGKSTLALLLEKLSLTDSALEPVQALGLDGFHYHADYIRTHTVERDGKQVPMSLVKGCPETFDVEHLLAKLAGLRDSDCRWPIYDRTTHDVVEEVIKVRRSIVLLEGNWLLLGDDRWLTVRNFADYSLFVGAEPQDLKERLIERKILGGKSREEAEIFYRNSDRINVERVLKKSWPADETWQMLSDGDYQLRGKMMPNRMVNRDVLWKKPDVTIDNSLLSGINRRISAEPGDVGRLYKNGYAEGLSHARKAILRKLYQDGTMSSKAIMETFELSDDELQDILK
ncbi:hypothetical protein SAMN02910356_01437 [Selenomonas sp. GACV-9]|uniref:nucleoside/nucleotide kinase family protein n=1 Tax=Selenomonas sp. GACV-9 TaxID=3158782 RepID=UPI0008F227A2|nr:hypothetical protein SAMN02910356_01437 [Selenomonas ruminantium]